MKISKNTSLTYNEKIIQETVIQKIRQNLHECSKTRKENFQPQKHIPYKSKIKRNTTIQRNKFRSSKARSEARKKKQQRAIERSKDTIV